jgi:hypothetical protein
MPVSTERSPHKPTKTLSLPGKRAAAGPAPPADHAGQSQGDAQKPTESQQCKLSDSPFKE